ncbi:MAG: hypothetical protein PVJ53_13445 [Desulfobacterales bacterium]
MTGVGSIRRTTSVRHRFRAPFRREFIPKAWLSVFERLVAIFFGQLAKTSRDLPMLKGVMIPMGA